MVNIVSKKLLKPKNINKIIIFRTLTKELEKASLFFYENGEMNYSKREEGKTPVFFAKMVFSQSTQDIFVKVKLILLGNT